MPKSSCYALWQRHVQVADEQNPLRTELGVVCKHFSHPLLVPPLDAHPDPDPKPRPQLPRRRRRAGRAASMHSYVFTGKMMEGFLAHGLTW